MNRLIPSIGAYLKENAASLVATVAVAGGWTAAAVAGGPKVLTGVCLAGGGMFATMVAHEVVKATVNAGTASVSNLKAAVEKFGIKRAVPKPAPVEETASAGA